MTSDVNCLLGMKYQDLIFSKFNKKKLDCHLLLFCMVLNSVESLITMTFIIKSNKVKTNNSIYWSVWRQWSVFVHKYSDDIFTHSVLHQLNEGK